MQLLTEKLSTTLLIYGGTITLINLIGFCLMGFDKHRAHTKGQRIPELTLMLFAFLGGAVGILLGMVIFKHKTSKTKFTYGVPLCYLFNKIVHLIVLSRY